VKFTRLPTERRRHGLEKSDPSCVLQVSDNLTVKVKQRRLGSLCLELCGSPLGVFLLEVLLDPGDGDGGPYTSPEEWQDPANLLTIRNLKEG
jgi:hypothetical protein